MCLFLVELSYFFFENCVVEGGKFAQGVVNEVNARQGNFREYEWLLLNALEECLLNILDLSLLIEYFFRDRTTLAFLFKYLN